MLCCYFCAVIFFFFFFKRPHCNFSFEIIKFTLPYLNLSYLTLPYKGIIVFVMFLPAIQRHVSGADRGFCQAVLALLPLPGLWCGWHLHPSLPVHLHRLPYFLHPLHVLPQVRIFIPLFLYTCLPSLLPSFSTCTSSGENLYPCISVQL